MSQKSETAEAAANSSQSEARITLTEGAFIKPEIESGRLIGDRDPVGKLIETALPRPFHRRPPGDAQPLGFQRWPCRGRSRKLAGHRSARPVTNLHHSLSTDP